MNTAEAAAVGAAVFAAVAAGASWVAVVQSRKSFKMGLLPRLAGSWTNPPAGGLDQMATLYIQNTGSGFAHETHLYVISENKRVLRRIEPAGLLAPGASAPPLTLELPRHEGVGTGIMFCLDWTNRWHVWSWDGRHRQLRKLPLRPAKPIDPDKTLRMFYPEAPRGDALGTAKAS